MVQCLCIDDSNRPKEIPVEKWVKKGQLYNIIYTVTVLPQKEIGVVLSEIELTEKELPYEYFLLRRFAVEMYDISKLLKLIKDCSDTDFSVDDLMKETLILNLAEK
jgi:hypothetical protein